ncbi:MAG: exosortase/archaeosortase family protein [Thermosynechococcaceae cyanobacterium MS004]|nr:exosortase/archaeosortase family protein [Thermosynechococcaceae cyanobacterium MS004]
MPFALEPMFLVRFKTLWQSSFAPPALASFPWLIALSLGLIALHLTLLWRVGLQMDDLVLNSAFWAVLYPKLYQKYHRAHVGESAIAFWIGVMLVAGILMRCTSLYGIDAPFAKLMPLLIIISMGLIASGWKVYRDWPQLLLIAPLAMPQTLINSGMSHGAGEPLQIATAKTATFVLHYLGFAISTHQTIITLPQGSVEIELACTAFPSLLVLLQLAVLFGAMLPIPWRQQAVVWTLSASFAGVASVVRVAILAFSVDRPELFSFWHGDPGQQIISTGLILCMVTIHHFFYRQGELQGVTDAQG